MLTTSNLNGVQRNPAAIPAVAQPVAVIPGTRFLCLLRPFYSPTAAPSHPCISCASVSPELCSFERPSAASPSIEWRNARSRRLCSCLPRDANRELQVTLQAGGVACTLVGPCTMNPIADKSPLFRVHPRTSLRLLDCSCARSTG